jgi:hypothetical protein
VPTSARPAVTRAAVATPLFGRRQLLGSAAAFGSVLLSARPAAAVDEASALAIKVLNGAAKELDGADALIQAGQWSELRNTVKLSLDAVVKGGVKARAAAVGGESEKALLAARATLLSSLQAADKVAYDEQKKSFKNSKALFNAEGAGDEVSRAASTNIAAAKTALASITRELSKANVPPPTGEPKEAPTGITFLTKPTSP